MSLQCRFLDNMENFKEVANDKIYIYGAGRTAKIVIYSLLQENKNVGKILVSNKDNNPRSILGVNVEEIGTVGLEENIPVIVCVMERLHESVRETLLLAGISINTVYFLSDRLIGIIERENADFQVEQLETTKHLQNEVKSLKKEISELWEQVKKERVEIKEKQDYMLMDIKRSSNKFISKPCLEYMVLNILDHCNLKCKGCDHFACIADPYFVPLETIKSDVVQLGKILNNDNIMQMGIMGGEPLLHPYLLEILSIVRENFPFVKIRLTTNGILLLQQKSEFWETCKKNKVTIVVTKYPINLDFELMKRTAEEYGVEYQYFEGTGEELVKTSFKKIINLKGNSNPVDSFANCHISNYGNFLMEGKFYGCPFSCQSSRIFNSKFGAELRLTENDYLDIYKVEDMKELFDFAARPRMYCRYCVGLSPAFDWSRTEKNMEEWV